MMEWLATLQGLDGSRREWQMKKRCFMNSRPGAVSGPGLDSHCGHLVMRRELDQGSEAGHVTAIQAVRSNMGHPSRCTSRASARPCGSFDIRCSSAMETIVREK